jgi:hypothetical protein
MTPLAVLAFLAVLLLIDGIRMRGSGESQRHPTPSSRGRA